MQQSVLDRWAGKSLQERCILFHRHFGNHRINRTLLSKVYRIHKIKRKKIKKVKLIDPDKEVEYENWRKEIKEVVRKLKFKQYRIIYLDECIFTTKTLKSIDYTLLKTPHRIAQTSINQPVFALIFAISEENGLEHYRIYKKLIDYEKFNEYLDELYVANKHDNIAIFLDNLKVHLKHEVTMKLNELDIETVQNVPY